MEETQYQSCNDAPHPRTAGRMILTIGPSPMSSCVTISLLWPSLFCLDTSHLGLQRIKIALRPVGPGGRNRPAGRLRPRTLPPTL